MVANAETVDPRRYDVAFADPARRRGSTRLFDPRAFSPPWDFVLGLLAADEGGSACRRAVVKLAPGLDHAMVPPHAEAEWVSLDGNLKEVALWSPAAGSVRRRATLLRTAGSTDECSDESAPTDPPIVRDVGAFVYEPDPAVVRAHLVSVVVGQVSGWLVDPHIAYVSSDRQVGTALASGFRVLDVLPFKERALRAALRARRVGTLTIKKRGVNVTPEELRRRLGLKGEERATLILTRTPGSALALLVEPLD
jgi:THUMP domain-like